MNDWVEAGIAAEITGVARGSKQGVKLVTFRLKGQSDYEDDYEWELVDSNANKFLRFIGAGEVYCVLMARTSPKDDPELPENVVQFPGRRSP